MKFFKIILAIYMLPLSTFSQNTLNVDFYEIDKKALDIPESMTQNTDLIAQYIQSNFNSEQEKVRATFVWVASNISYDTKYSYNASENRDQKIRRSLLSRKGICENYAALFTEICNKIGIKSYVVEGYTKQNSVVSKQSHAWSASEIGGFWYLFDPTWGSGQIDNGKFIKKLNNRYFLQSPENFISSHMPFDFLWQFLDSPFTNQEFYDGKISVNLKKKNFNYREGLKEYENQEREAQLQSSVLRIEKNGPKNDLILKQLKYLKSALHNIEQNKIITQYNIAASHYNEALNRYNEFINFRNKQLIARNPDSKIKEIVDTAENNLKKAKTILSKLPSADAKIAANIKDLKQSVDSVFLDVLNQKLWLKSYLAENRSGRKSIFFENKPSISASTIN